MATDALVGRTMGHHLVLEVLGEGGMGVVYKARDTRLGRPVALKVMRPDAMGNADHQRRLVREAQAASALNHPNILTIYEIDTDGNVTYIAMEYIAGGRLAELIASGPFARVRCGECRAEYLVAFSCKGRGLCPSCAAKRAAALAAFLREEVLANVGHAQWVFSIPKMLRPYFLYHRPLLGRLCRAAYETARAMIAAASRDGEQLLPGMIAVVQTFGDDLNWHPHVHALVTRGGWDREGVWTPVPFVDGETAALHATRNLSLRGSRAQRGNRGNPAKIDEIATSPLRGFSR